MEQPFLCLATSPQGLAGPLWMWDNSANAQVGGVYALSGGGAAALRSDFAHPHSALLRLVASLRVGEGQAERSEAGGEANPWNSPGFPDITENL